MLTLVVRQSLTEIFESNHRCYGYRRLQASLAREQGPISEKVVQRLMKQENLVVAKPKRRRFNSMLDAAIETVADTSDRPVVHSDRGGHYRWPGWLSRMSEANLTRSMSRKACSPDNAACEGFFGRLKNELFYPRDWKGTTIEQFIEVVDSYIRWYNEKRIKISLGSLSPVEYRASLGLAA